MWKFVIKLKNFTSTFTNYNSNSQKRYKDIFKPSAKRISKWLMFFSCCNKKGEKLKNNFTREGHKNASKLIDERIFCQRQKTRKKRFRWHWILWKKNSFNRFIKNGFNFFMILRFFQLKFNVRGFFYWRNFKGLIFYLKLFFNQQLNGLSNNFWLKTKFCDLLSGWTV